MQQMTKNEQAYQTLKKMIITGEFSDSAAGTWSLRSLAQRFGMSVVPVSEAVRRLEQEGLLQVRPQQGIMLRLLSLREIQELTVVREGIEVQAARLLAMAGSDEDRRMLTAMAKDVTALLQRREVHEADFQDYRLHRELV